MTEAKVVIRVRMTKPTKDGFAYLKQLICHCLSRAINAWPSFSTSLQPAHPFGSYGPSCSMLREPRPFWLCWWAVARVGLLANSRADVECTGRSWAAGCCLLFGTPLTHDSHSTSFPVFVTWISNKQSRVSRFNQQLNIVFLTWHIPCCPIQTVADIGYK